MIKYTVDGIIEKMMELVRNTDSLVKVVVNNRDVAIYPKYSVIIDKSLNNIDDINVSLGNSIFGKGWRKIVIHFNEIESFTSNTSGIYTIVINCKDGTRYNLISDK